ISFAQDSSGRAAIRLFIETDKDSVVLRWSAGSPGSLQFAMEHGYIIERAEVTDDHTFDPKTFRTLTPKPILPWATEEWNKRIKNFSRRRNIWSAKLEMANSVCIGCGRKFFRIQVITSSVPKTVAKRTNGSMTFRI